MQYLDSWVDGTLAHQVMLGQIRQTTADSYADVADLMIIPYLGRRRIDELKPAVLREWLATLRRTRNARGRAYSSRSVQIAHGVLRRALNDAVRDELIPRNVALLVKPGRVDSPAPQPLRPEEIRALLTEAQHDRLYPLWLLLVTLGLRRGEALALRWTDIDLDQGTLTVARSLQRIRTGELTPSGRRRGRLAEVPPKTAGSIRRIALPGVLVDALTAHRQQQDTEREAASYWGDDDLVFTSSIGTWLEPQNVYKAWHELCERAGVRRCRPHDLRHTAASILLLQGADMRSSWTSSATPACPPPATSTPTSCTRSASTPPSAWTPSSAGWTAHRSRSSLVGHNPGRRYLGYSWTASARKHGILRAQVRHVVETSRVVFVRPAAPPTRPDEALLFLGDDSAGHPIEVVGIEMDNGRLRVIHAMPMRRAYRALYEEATQWPQ